MVIFFYPEEILNFILLFFTVTQGRLTFAVKVSLDADLIVTADFSYPRRFLRGIGRGTERRERGRGVYCHLDDHDLIDGHRSLGLMADDTLMHLIIDH